MIVAGCLGMGLWYRERFIGRLKTLRDLQRIQDLLISEIRYGRSTLPECCNCIAGHLEEPYGGCFMRVYERMRENTGIAFGQIFRDEWEGCLANLPLVQEDKTRFLELFTDNGFADESMQIRTIEQGKELLQHTIESLERENTEKCRMAVGLGAMSGVLLLIILF